MHEQQQQQKKKKHDSRYLGEGVCGWILNWYTGQIRLHSLM